MRPIVGTQQTLHSCPKTPRGSSFRQFLLCACQGPDSGYGGCRFTLDRSSGNSLRVIASGRCLRRTPLAALSRTRLDGAARPAAPLKRNHVLTVRLHHAAHRSPERDASCQPLPPAPGRSLRPHFERDTTDTLVADLRAVTADLRRSKNDLRQERGRAADARSKDRGTRTGNRAAARLARARHKILVPVKGAGCARAGNLQRPKERAPP
jgi:hypothetical protein